MGIAIVTIPGDAHRAFVNELHERTGGMVDLVIVQRPKHQPLFSRLSRFYRAVGWRRLLSELWHTILLRFDRRVRSALEHFRAATLPGYEPYRPRMLEVDSVNSEEVYEELSRLAPDLLVVWGSAILSPRIHQTARRAINLHHGHCPFYRGALANQHAVLNGEFSRLGATIHYINGRADAGDILALVTADVMLPPREFFRMLNTAAREKYVEIAARLSEGEELPREHQDSVPAHILLLKEWTPSVRYRVGKRVLAWEKQAQSSVSRKTEPALLSA